MIITMQLLMKNEVVLISTNPQYDSSIDVDEDTKLVGNYPTYLSEIIVPDGSKAEALVDHLDLNKFVWTRIH